MKNKQFVAVPVCRNQTGGKGAKNDYAHAHSVLALGFYSLFMRWKLFHARCLRVRIKIYSFRVEFHHTISWKKHRHRFIIHVYNESDIK